VGWPVERGGHEGVGSEVEPQPDETKERRARASANRDGAWVRLESEECTALIV